MQRIRPPRVSGQLAVAVGFVDRVAQLTSRRGAYDVLSSMKSRALPANLSSAMLCVD